MKSSSAINSTILGAASASAVGTVTINSQFKSTIMWNGIIAHMRSKLAELNSSSRTGNGAISSRLRKQHSRFVSGGMLLIRPTQVDIENHMSAATSATNTTHKDIVYFTGAQCVDIVYQYLIENRHVLNFERQVTRDKCVKLCQLIMESGVFEPANNRSTIAKFDDSSLKIYRLTTIAGQSQDHAKSEHNEQVKEKLHITGPTKMAEKVDLCDDDDNYKKKSTTTKTTPTTFSLSHVSGVNNKENYHRQGLKSHLCSQSNIDKNNNNNNQLQNVLMISKTDGSNEDSTTKMQTPNRIASNNHGLLFSKSGFLNKTSNVNTKLKRKLISMKRSSTVHSLLPDDEIDDVNSTSCKANIYESNTTSVLPASTTMPIKPSASKCSNTKSLLYSSINPNLEASTSIQKSERSEHVDTFRPPMSKLARTKSIDHSDIKAVKYANNKLAQELLMTRQITRELIIEKLLSLIDLPIIEHLLSIDERNDIEYCQALERFETVILNPSSSSSAHQNKSSSTILNKDAELLKANILSKSSINYIQRSLSILGVSYDISRLDLKDEWRRCVNECLEFLEWDKFAPQSERELFQSEIDKNVRLLLMKDVELYALVRDLYSQRQKSGLFFMDDSFQPLFSNIIVFIKKNHYAKALEILNLGTLLLLKQTQAELKRLLKFLYLTANSVHSPKLSDTKPNNSIVLNHFASCLLNPKIIGFEESRLLLSFMINNFDMLFKLTKPIEESICKRKLLMQRYGQEEALLENLYCKKISNEEFHAASKEQTSKALVDLINHIIDDPQISLKQKKLKLKALQRIHPDVYEKHFADFF